LRVHIQDMFCVYSIDEIRFGYRFADINGGLCQVEFSMAELCACHEDMCVLLEVLNFDVTHEA
jgi:hypothetical protein